jgi:hypothetical protein
MDFAPFLKCRPAQFLIHRLGQINRSVNNAGARLAATGLCEAAGAGWQCFGALGQNILSARFPIGTDGLFNAVVLCSTRATAFQTRPLGLLLP